MPIQKYHMGPPRWWSKTSLRNFQQYGPKWMGKFLRDEVRTERPDGALQGMALDVYLTEGAEEFAKQFAIKPDGLSLATKEGKAWKESQTLDTIGQDDADAAQGMYDSIMANVHAAHILSISPERETPLFANIRGVPCKALLDAHGTDGEEWWIADLKTTDDASPTAFWRSVEKYHYDLQAEMYCEILSRHHQIESRPYWLWIVVQKTPPYTCVVYDRTGYNESGEAKLERVLASFKECTASGEWPQPWQGINQLPKQKWA